MATLDAVDPDGAGAFSFALLDDAGGLFEIVGNEIVVAAGAVLDFEMQSSYPITVEVTDASGLSHTQSFVITVLDVNEGPTDILVTGDSVLENAAAGTLVASLAAVDPEPGDTFTFEIDDPSGFFEIVGNEVRVAAGALIDYETATEHLVTLRVTDAAGDFYEEELTITVENVAPIIIGNNAANTLIGTSEEDQIFGRGGNDQLFGEEGDDLLFGEAGNDRLAGGAGADTLTGGLNNDTYVLSGPDDAAGDIIVEAAGQGTDTVEVDQDYTLGANLENLVLTGTDDIQGIGNELANAITGNAGHNLIDGGLGIDTMTGGAGDDVYYVDVAADRVIEGAGAGIDEIRTGLASHSIAALGNVENLTFVGTGNFTGTGNGQANVITGAGGHDTLDGAGGADMMVGGEGDDTYIVNNVGDQVVELVGAGVDTVRSAISYTLGDDVENLVLTGGGALNGTGNVLVNRITGGTGANTLDGGAGADTLAGGAGNDTYVVDNLGDVLIEAAGQGTDTVRTGLADYGLETSANVENLTFIGVGDFTGRGNDLANTITGGGGNDALHGNAGNDTLVGGLGNDSLSGGLGADTMRGNAGNDAYVVDNTGDSVTESAGEGIDTVSASVNFTLGANVENLTLTGSAVSGTGNGLANVLTGSGGANTLNGAGGNDRLIGGGGNDTLTGGTGLDTFVFADGFGRDTVTDFRTTGASADTIEFSTDVFSSFAQVQAAMAQVGADVVITVDVDNSLTLRNVALANLNAGDFLFV